MTPIQISLVIPIFNEEELIDELFKRTIEAMHKITDSFEIICVDDGSTDSSLEKMIECHQKDGRFKVLVLSRNFGHQSAYTAGLEYAKGEYMAMMDGDLQDPPELIAQMYKKITDESLDVVYGKRISRNEPLFKKALIKLFHSIFKHFSKMNKIENVGNFSLFSWRVKKSLLAIKEKNRYLPGLRFFVGFKQSYIEYDRQERILGTPKMNLKKLFNLALDAIFSFSDLPIKVCLYTGLFGMTIFFAGLIYSFISKIMGIAPFGWSSLVVSIYFLGSVQLLFLGIIGEYIYRIYIEIQNRPLYFIERFIDE